MCIIVAGEEDRDHRSDSDRKDASLRIIECIKEMRADPELNNPNIATLFYLTLQANGAWNLLRSRNSSNKLAS